MSGRVKKKKVLQMECPGSTFISISRLTSPVASYFLSEAVNADTLSCCAWLQRNTV
jgi:hypothetical protein